jgi:hypothetical protein
VLALSRIGMHTPSIGPNTTGQPFVAVSHTTTTTTTARGGARERKNQRHLRLSPPSVRNANRTLGHRHTFMQVEFYILFSARLRGGKLVEKNPDGKIRRCTISCHSRKNCVPGVRIIVRYGVKILQNVIAANYKILKSLLLPQASKLTVNCNATVLHSYITVNT